MSLLRVFSLRLDGGLRFVGFLGVKVLRKG